MEDYKYQWKYKDEERPWDKAVCYDCKMPYKEFQDMVVPNELWEIINPTYHKEAGLLCPTCIVNRLNHVNKWYDFMDWYLKEYSTR